MWSRPRYDPDSAYFTTTFDLECQCLQAHQRLVRSMVDCIMEAERSHSERLWEGRSQQGKCDPYICMCYYSTYIPSLHRSSFNSQSQGVWAGSPSFSIPLCLPDGSQATPASLLPPRSLFLSLLPLRPSPLPGHCSHRAGGSVCIACARF